MDSYGSYIRAQRQALGATLLSTRVLQGGSDSGSLVSDALFRWRESTSMTSCGGEVSTGAMHIELNPPAHAPLKH
eukprot:1855767-Amphidinium_carterae.1